MSNLNHQILIHSGLVGTSLLFLPIVPFSTDISFGWQSPQFGIIFSLFIGIGFPYFLLSSTAPLIQKWYSCVPKNNEPYRLYSLSNLGSLLALLSYPFLIEPNMSTDLQANTWSIGYCVFAVLILLIGYQLYGRVFEDSKVIADSKQGEFGTEFSECFTLVVVFRR